MNAGQHDDGWFNKELLSASAAPSDDRTFPDGEVRG